MYPGTITFGKQKIGSSEPVFIIAEAGVNHTGSLDMAYQLIDVAAQTGANAVKFQTFKAEHLVTPDAPKAYYQQQTTNATESQYEMLRRLELPFEAYGKLMAYCQTKDIIFLSTPFDEESAHVLSDLGVPGFKLGSGEITNLPYLRHILRLLSPDSNMYA